MLAMSQPGLSVVNCFAPDLVACVRSRNASAPFQTKPLTLVTWRQIDCLMNYCYSFSGSHFFVLQIAIVTGRRLHVYPHVWENSSRSIVVAMSDCPFVVSVNARPLVTRRMEISGMADGEIAIPRV